MAVEDAWAAFAIGAMLCLGLSDFLNKRAMMAGVKRTQFLVVQSYFFTITTIILLPLVGGLELSPALLFAVAAGAITFVSYVFVLKALETGEASVAVPIYRMSFGVTVVLAIVIIGEELTASRVLGFAFIMLALVTLTAVKGKVFQSSEGMPVSPKGTGRNSVVMAAAFATVAMVTIGTKGFLYKVGIVEGAPPTMFALVQSLTFLPIAIVYTLVSDRTLHISRLTWSHAPYNGVLTALASVLLLLALVGGDASVAVPISQLCFVVTAILAVIIFQERLTPLKMIGIVAAVLAVVVLSTTLGLA
jgi:transporter family protein